jgi:quinoprotein glucose dehydrogenase
MVETGMGRAGKRKADLSEGERVYQLNCALCHGPKLEGDPTGTYPGLSNLGEKLKKEDVLAILSQGRNLMPAFAHISGKEREAVTNFLLGSELKGDAHDLGSENNRNVLPFSHTGYRRFVDSNGNPAIKPPWGKLNAIDLEKGEILWQVTLGEFDELTAQGIPKTGTENYGGPVVTSGGLIFIAATKDEYIRAFDQESGEELWKFKLPAAAYATPSTYMIDGKQYLVIACGGGKIGSKPGDSIVAFALP